MVKFLPLRILNTWDYNLCPTHLVCLFCSWYKVSLCYPSWPQTWDLPRVLGPRVCSTVPASMHFSHPVLSSFWVYFLGSFDSVQLCLPASPAPYTFAVWQAWWPSGWKWNTPRLLKSPFFLMTVKWNDPSQMPLTLFFFKLILIFLYIATLRRETILASDQLPSILCHGL